MIVTVARGRGDVYSRLYAGHPSRKIGSVFRFKGFWNVRTSIGETVGLLRDNGRPYRVPKTQREGVAILCQHLYPDVPVTIVSESEFDRTAYAS